MGPSQRPLYTLRRRVHGSKVWGAVKHLQFNVDLKPSTGFRGGGQLKSVLSDYVVRQHKNHIKCGGQGELKSMLTDYGVQEKYSLDSIPSRRVQRSISVQVNTELIAPP